MWFKNILISVECAIFCYVVCRNVANVKALMGDDIRQARENEFPFIAGIVRRNRSFMPERDIICTASLITDHNIITAEHCVNKEATNGIQIVIGSIDLLSVVKYYVAWWITYDQWEDLNKASKLSFHKNDICIIRLTSTVTDGTRPAKLSYLRYKDLNEKSVVTAGWGKVNNNNNNNSSYPRMLQTAKLKILPSDECESKVCNLIGYNIKIEKNIICTIAKPFVIMMEGDSGGPILYNQNIVAINTGTCPMLHQHLHPDKINIHVTLRFYKQFVSAVINYF